MAPQATTLRILCLHGHRHNPAVMDAYMEPLRHAFGDSVEFVHVRAVSPALGEPDALVRRHHMDKAPFFEWFDVRRLEEHEDQDDEWFFQYEGLDDAILYMDAQLQRLGTFDAVLGFSQGAVLMTVLTMYYTQKQQPLPWRLCISVCGWRVRDYAWKFLFEDDNGAPLPVPVPSIHVAGTTDPLHCESVELVDQFAGDTAQSCVDAHASGVMPKLLIEFDGGHGFPQGEQYAELYTKLAQSIHDMCSSARAAHQEQTPTHSMRQLSRL